MSSERRKPGVTFLAGGFVVSGERRASRMVRGIFVFGLMMVSVQATAEPGMYNILWPYSDVSKWAFSNTAPGLCEIRKSEIMQANPYQPTTDPNACPSITEQWVGLDSNGNCAAKSVLTWSGGVSCNPPQVVTLNYEAFAPAFNTCPQIDSWSAPGIPKPIQCT